MAVPVAALSGQAPGCCKKLERRPRRRCFFDVRPRLVLEGVTDKVGGVKRRADAPGALQFRCVGAALDAPYDFPCGVVSLSTKRQYRSAVRLAPSQVWLWPAGQVTVTRSILVACPRPNRCRGSCAEP